MWYLSMKKFIILLGLFLLTAPANADQMRFKFKSPSFSGVNQSSHYLTIENQETSRKKEIQEKIALKLKEIEREEENSTQNKFLRNFESRIYSRLSKELVESMFEAGEIDPELNGSFYFSSEDYYLRYYMLDGILVMETYPGKYGEEGSYELCDETDLCTQIEVPVDSFSLYTDG